MKRILIILFVLVAISIGIFADGASWSGPSLEGAGTPIQNVSLNLQNMESYAIGFSTNDTGFSESVQTTILMPSADDSTIANNAGSDLFILWDITTTKKIEVKLSKTDLMNDDTPTPAEIAWSVAGVGTTGEGTVAAINIGTNSAEQPFITLAASKDGTLQHISGNQKLTLTTESLDGKKVDSYAATLTLTISNPA